MLDPPIDRVVAPPTELLMLPAVVPCLLARLTHRRHRGRRPPEAADMGTAFGMEQWLDERDQGGLPAKPRATAAKRCRLPRWLQGDPAP